MTDIAKAAGVSLATVGRVLHNNGYVSEDSRKKIETAVHQYGYVPNRVARSLKNRQSGIIGHVITISHTNTLMSRISSAIDRAAGEKGYHVLTLAGQTDKKMEETHINDLIGHMVEGIIFTSSSMVDANMLMRITELAIPVVMVERAISLPKVDAVLVDNVEGAFQAVWHMIEKGHKRIGFIGKNNTAAVEQDRYEGYCKAMFMADLAIPPGYRRFMPRYLEIYGYQAMRELLEQDTPPTAVFMTSDIFASGAMQYLYKKHLRVPDDISIIGYDNTLSTQLSPPITSVDFSMDDIGLRAIELLLERREHPEMASKTVWLRTEFVNRNSVRELSQQEW